MEKGSLNREQAIAVVGEQAVVKAEEKNCEPTGRVGYNGECQGDELCEWSASVEAIDNNGMQSRLTVYYYTTNEQDQAIADAGSDGSVIDWEIAGYEID